MPPPARVASGMCTENIETQIKNLGEGAGEIREAVEELSEDAFVGPLGNWSPRDIVAHLIGWNRYSVRFRHRPTRCNNSAEP